MLKVIFPHQIKYKGRYVEANTAFEVDESDKKELLKAGGKIVGEEKTVAKGEKNGSTTKAKNPNS